MIEEHRNAAVDFGEAPVSRALEAGNRLERAQRALERAVAALVRQAAQNHPEKEKAEG